MPAVDRVAVIPPRTAAARTCDERLAPDHRHRPPPDAGDRGTRLAQLTSWRAKPAVPFGGKHRIVDFALSNRINSGVRRIGVATQYKAHSLIQHLQRGWNFLDAHLQEFLDVLPAQQRLREDWPEHVERRADLTIACVDAPIESATEFGVMSVDADGRVDGFEDKPRRPAPLPEDPSRALVSMGIYAFDAERLYERLRQDAHRDGSSHDFGRDVIPGMLVDGASVFAHRFADSCVNMVDGQPYRRDVGIGRNVRLRRVIVDKLGVLPDGFEAGLDREADAARFHVTQQGVVLIAPEMLGQPIHDNS